MSRSARAALHVLSPVALAATLLVVPAHASPAPPAPRTERPAVTSDHRTPLLAGRVGGRAAVRQLGTDLPVAAARNGMAAAALEKVLTKDPTSRLDVDGRLHYIEPTLAEAGEGHTAHAEESSSDAAAATAPLSDTFRLHSRPGASKVIFLDFDGGDVVNTVWNRDGVQRSHPAWDPGRNGVAFSDEEKDVVQRVWAMVAEDFSSWDVDVTTQDPGEAGLVRESTDDTVYGARVLISPSTQAQGVICPHGCGGVAYIDVFDYVGTKYQTAWVFPHELSHSAKSVAEAASHEVGHTLDLLHDGGAGSSYYSGHGSWAPIMGVGYRKPIVQWSRGSYSGANNLQDDLTVIDRFLRRRPDEAGSTPGTAVAPTASPGVIATTGDVDTYALGSCTAGASVVASTAAVSPNLDLELVLTDAGGTVLGRHNPSASSTDGITGVTPTVTLTGAQPQVFASVRGTGLGSWSSQGYDNYASLGVYTLAIAGCDAEGVSIASPGVPRSVAARRGDGHATVSWQPPASGGPVGAYRVVAGSGQTMATVSGGSTTAKVSGLRNGTSYRFSVVATNTSGASASAPTATVVPAGVPNRVARPAARSKGRRLALRWRAPSANGAAIRRYQVKLRGPRSLQLRTTGRRAVLRGLPRGRYRVRVMAVNEVGRSAWSPVRRQRLGR